MLEFDEHNVSDGLCPSTTKSSFNRYLAGFTQADHHHSEWIFYSWRLSWVCLNQPPVQGGTPKTSYKWGVVVTPYQWP